MAWNASLTSDSALGESIIFTPDTTMTGEYTVSSFTAPRKGVYRFELRGSGGATRSAAGGVGGSTVGYLLLEKEQTVYIGAGGFCSAAFVSLASGEKLSDIDSSSLLFVAGAGGSGGKSGNDNADRVVVTAGGNGGGSSGAQSLSDGDSTPGNGGGYGGTQSAGGKGYGNKMDGTLPEDGAYGVGGTAGQDYSGGLGYAYGGRGGDGYFGGGGGAADAVTNSTTGRTEMIGYGGGGGSGYVKTATLTVGSNTYVSSTIQGGGAGSDECGGVIVTYYARAELPIVFNGTKLEKIIFNGVEIESLIFNGTTLF